VTAKTVAGWAAVTFICWWVIQNPADAAHLVHNVGAFMSSTASAVSQFFART
jgi:hypothetical protein